MARYHRNCHKRPFRTALHAEAEAVRIQLRRGDGMECGWYQCPRCSMWHLTTRGEHQRRMAVDPAYAEAELRRKERAKLARPGKYPTEHFEKMPKRKTKPR